MVPKIKVGFKRKHSEEEQKEDRISQPPKVQIGTPVPNKQIFSVETVSKKPQKEEQD